MHQRFTLLAALALGICALACTHSSSTQATTVIVVRHAEKQAVAKDPGLTAAGEDRARRLRDLALDAGVTSAYATQYRRTRDTVQPLATALGLDVEVVDASDLEGLASRILSSHRGSTVVVAGHSNTVPGIVAALGAIRPAPIDESEYGNLFVVTIPATGQATALRLRF